MLGSRRMLVLSCYVRLVRGSCPEDDVDYGVLYEGGGRRGFVYILNATDFEIFPNRVILLPKERRMGQLKSTRSTLLSTAPLINADDLVTTHC